MVTLAGRGAGALENFNERGEFEAWLSKETREVLVALCAREALRKLPFVQTAKHDGYEECLVLPIFRATAALWAFANYPRPDIERAAARAVSEVDDAFADKVIDARLRPAILRKILESASEAALGLICSAFDQNRGAAAALQADAAAIASGYTILNILACKLWPAARPREIARLWKDLKENLLAQTKNSRSGPIGMTRARAAGLLSKPSKRLE